MSDTARQGAGWVATVLVGLLASGGGCATIISGSTERIRFESEPPGAQVTVDGRTYTAPVEVELSRDTGHRVEFALPGHATMRRYVWRDDNTWVIGSRVLGGFPGVVIDQAIGGGFDLEPDVVSVRLIPLPPPRQP